jgi:hypothetical protein
MSEDQMLAEREPLLSAEDLEHTPVYPIIHMIAAVSAKPVHNAVI